MSKPKFGFEMNRIRIPLTNILPVRNIKDPKNNIRRYRVIMGAIKEVGMIEPLMVHPQKGAPGKYLLVDGHLRRLALIELGETEADCVVAKDDESFTYNARVSRLAPIQEHRMIAKAVSNGVSPQRIAAALNMTVKEVEASLTLLDGIHAEAADLLKDKQISPRAIWKLKKVNGVRQIEIAELMVSTNNFTANYVEALVLGTPKDQWVDPEEPKQKEGLSPEEIGRLETEMESLERDLKSVEDSYGENFLNLTLARGYIKKLLENGKMVRFLNAQHGDILTEFERIAAAETV